MCYTRQRLSGVYGVVQWTNTTFCDGVWIILMFPSQCGIACGQRSSSLALATFPPILSLLLDFHIYPSKISKKLFNLCSFDYYLFYLK